MPLGLALTWHWGPRPRPRRPRRPCGRARMSVNNAAVRATTRRD